MTNPYRYQPSETEGCVDIYHGDIYLGVAGTLANKEIGFVCPGGIAAQAPTLEEAALKMARIYRMHNGLLPGENQ